MNKHIQIDSAKSISRARLLLLAGCYSISASAILFTVGLMYDFFKEVPGGIADYIKVIWVILCFTAVGQMIYNERLLAPIQSYLEPLSGGDRKRWNPLSAAAILLVLWLVICTFIYIALSLFTETGISFLGFIALVLATGLPVCGVFFFTLKEKAKKTDDISGEKAFNALLKLPLASALFSLAMWFFAGLFATFGFHYLIGLSTSKSFEVFVTIVCAGTLAFPAQYFLFKYFSEPLGRLFLDKDIFVSKEGYRFFLRGKLTISMGALVLYTVGFFGVLIYSKSDWILKKQAEMFLNNILASTLSVEENPTQKTIYARLESTGEIYEAAPFLIVSENVILSRVDLPRHDELIKAVAERNDTRVRLLRLEDLVVTLPVGTSEMRGGLIYPYENILPMLNEVRNKALIFGALILLVATGLGVLTARDISRPLGLMREEARRFSTGDFEWRSKLLSDDEAADLAIGFRAMSDEIVKQVKHVNKLIENIELTVHHLGASAGELETIARQQAAGSSQQAAAIQQAVTTAGEIAATSKQIAESALTVHNVATESQSACEESSKGVSRTIGGVEEVREHVNAVAHGTLELGQLSLQIGGIMDIIEEINEQTNLLSVNASIEASGAGEEGKRFAVLAKEIRRLNEGTKDATDQIRSLVDLIRKSTTSTIMMAEESTKVVDSWAKQVERLGEAFSNISAFVELASNATGEIRTSTRQQTTACEQMAQVVTEVKEVADQVVISSKETEKSMADLADLTNNLKEFVEDKSIEGENLKC